MSLIKFCGEIVGVVLSASIAEVNVLLPPTFLMEQKSLLLPTAEILVITFDVTSPGRYIMPQFQLGLIQTAGTDLTNISSLLCIGGKMLLDASQVQSRFTCCSKI